MPTLHRGDRGWVELDALIFLAVLMLVVVGIAGSARVAISGATSMEKRLRNAIYEANQQTHSIMLAAER